MSEQSAAQVAEQSVVQKHPGGNPAWVRGVNGRRWARERVEVEARKIAADLGCDLDALGAIDRGLVMRTAALNVARPAASGEEKSAGNTYLRLVAAIERRLGKRKPANGFGSLVRAKP